MYYPLGVAIGKIYSDKIPNVKTQVQATKASVENLVLLQQGRGEIAFTLGDSLESRLGRRRGGRLQDQAEQAAHHRRDLSELHPDRRDRRQRHQDAGRPQGQEPLGRRAEIRHRAQFARHPGRRRHELQGSRQGRISAVRRIRRPDEEPPAQRDAAIGRPRRRLAQGPFDLDRYHRRVGAEGGRRQDRPALRRGDDPGQHLYRPGQGRADRGGGELSRHQFGRLRRSRLSDDQADLRSLCPNWPTRTPPARRSSSRAAATAARCRCIRARSAITRKRA